MAGGSFEFTARDAGRFALGGALDFTTATAVLSRGEKLFAGVSGPIEIDLSGVRQADSAGLAVLLEWLGRAARARQTITFRNVPEQLRAIARISELEQLIMPSAA